MKTQLITLIGLSVALMASAAEPEQLPPTPVTGAWIYQDKAPEGAKDAWAFKKGEFSVESYWSIRFQGSFNDGAQAIGVGVGYSLTPNLVVSVRGVSYLDSPQGVNEILGRIAYRAPLSFLSPKLAPYAFTEGGGNLQTGIGFAGAGGGLQWRILKHVNLFAEADLRMDTAWKSSIGGAGGINLSF